jgi:hypothetical protein
MGRSTMTFPSLLSSYSQRLTATQSFSFGKCFGFALGHFAKGTGMGIHFLPKLTTAFLNCCATCSAITPLSSWTTADRITDSSSSFSDDFFRYSLLYSRSCTVSGAELFSFIPPNKHESAFLSTCRQKIIQTLFWGNWEGWHAL